MAPTIAAPTRKARRSAGFESPARILCEDARRHYGRPEDIPPTTARRLRRLLVLAQGFRAESEEAMAGLIADGAIGLAFGESEDAATTIAQERP
jgi:hypothetical protein